MSPFDVLGDAITYKVKPSSDTLSVSHKHNILSAHEAAADLKTFFFFKQAEQYLFRGNKRTVLTYICKTSGLNLSMRRVNLCSATYTGTRRKKNSRNAE